MKQTERILQFMRNRGSITQRDAIALGCYRLGARIFDLKNAGYNITAQLKRVTNSDGTKANIAVYTLREGDRNG